MNSYILSIDQGTTSSRVILFDEKCQSIHTEQKEFNSIYPSPGYVEQDAEMIYNDIVELITKCITNSQISPKHIKAIGITNQRETTVIWDKATGKPIHNAIVWQSKQSDHQCDSLQEQSHETTFHQKTGLVLNPYFSCTKIMWILDNVPNARKRAEDGELLFGTIDTWLLYNLTNGAHHHTDVSNASRTLLFNIHTKQWDTELLRITNIPYNILPSVQPSSSDFGVITDIPILSNVHVTGIAGDQQSALFGHGSPIGGCKSTYGTGGFVVKNVGTEISPTPKGLLTTIGWEINGKMTYAVEGSVMTAGAALRWIRDLGIFTSYKEIAGMIPPDNDGVYFVPAFQGLGTPYWDDDCRGMIIGLTGGTCKGHIIRATLESIAFQCAQVIDLMGEMNEIKVDGGVSNSDFLCQFQSNLCNCKVIRLKEKEITAMGVAMLAGINIGLFDQNKLDEMRVVEKVFVPQMNDKQRSDVFEKWNKVVQTARSFYN
ncbi:glycerol kinase [Entamoeba marina]